MDPDAYSEYGSGSTKLLNTEPIRIRIHNTALQLYTLLTFVDDEADSSANPNQLLVLER